MYLFFNYQSQLPAVHLSYVLLALDAATLAACGLRGLSLPDALSQLTLAGAPFLKNGLGGVLRAASSRAEAAAALAGLGGGALATVMATARDARASVTAQATRAADEVRERGSDALDAAGAVLEERGAVAIDAVIARARVAAEALGPAARLSAAMALRRSLTGILLAACPPAALVSALLVRGRGTERLESIVAQSGVKFHETKSMLMDRGHEIADQGRGLADQGLATALVCNSFFKYFFFFFFFFSFNLLYRAHQFL
jgi:hypothetical protein